jgi:hypothetical protein
MDATSPPAAKERPVTRSETRARELPPAQTTHNWPQRLELLRQRAARGQELFNPRDRVLFDGR